MNSREGSKFEAQGVSTFVEGRINHSRGPLQRPGKQDAPIQSMSRQRSVFIWWQPRVE